MAKKTKKKSHHLRLVHPEHPERNDDGTLRKGFSGNPKGKPKRPKNFEVEFRRALRTVEKEKGKTLLKHIIRRAFKSDQVAKTVLCRMLPELRSIEARQTFSDMSDEQAKSIREKLKARFADGFSVDVYEDNEGESEFDEDDEESKSA